jgi:hypothetical protein
MSDEFDDATWPAARRREKGHVDARRDRTPPVPRLVARLYLSADQPLRVKLLACLTRPLSPLGLAAVAAGAFARLLFVGGATGATGEIEEGAQFTSDQILELARFVEQVSPQALQQFASMIVKSPVGVAAFSAAAVGLLLRGLPGSSDFTHRIGVVAPAPADSAPH